MLWSLGSIGKINGGWLRRCALLWLDVAVGLEEVDTEEWEGVVVTAGVALSSWEGHTPGFGRNPLLGARETAVWPWSKQVSIQGRGQAWK